MFNVRDYLVQVPKSRQHKTRQCECCILYREVLCTSCYQSRTLSAHEHRPNYFCRVCDNLWQNIYLRSYRCELPNSPTKCCNLLDLHNGRNRSRFLPLSLYIKFNEHSSLSARLYTKTVSFDRNNG